MRYMLALATALALAIPAAASALPRVSANPANELLSHGMLPIRLLRELMVKDKAKWDEVL